MTKAVTIRGNFTSLQCYPGKQEKSQINNLILHLKELDKEQKQHKVRRRTEIIKIIAELSEIENKSPRLQTSH